MIMIPSDASLMQVYSLLMFYTTILLLTSSAEANFQGRASGALDRVYKNKSIPWLDPAGLL